MLLLVVRHGRTLENDAGILQWRLPGTLSPLGRRQAELLAARLSSERIDRIVSSDLSRAADTAREIARYHPDTTVELTEELRERYLGLWQGRRKADLPLMDGWDMEDVTVPGGETNAGLAARARGLIGRLVSAGSPNETVLLVGHSDLNREIIRTLLGPEHDGFTRNASLSIFRVDEAGRATCELFDSTEHLLER